jgi:hypothetical protein
LIKLQNKKQKNTGQEYSKTITRLKRK